MLIRTSTIDEIAVLDLSGRLGVENGTALRDRVSEAIHAGRRQVVLSLLDVSEIDAAGLGELAHAFSSLRLVGGELKLVVRCPAICELLARTKLLELFPTFVTEADAVASFQPKAQLRPYGFTAKQ